MAPEAESRHSEGEPKETSPFQRVVSEMDTLSFTPENARTNDQTNRLRQVKQERDNFINSAREKGFLNGIDGRVNQLYRQILTAQSAEEAKNAISNARAIARGVDIENLSLSRPDLNRYKLAGMTGLQGHYFEEAIDSLEDRFINQPEGRTPNDPRPNEHRADWEWKPDLNVEQEVEARKAEERARNEAWRAAGQRGRAPGMEDMMSDEEIGNMPPFDYTNEPGRKEAVDWLRDYFKARAAPPTGGGRRASEEEANAFKEREGLTNKEAQIAWLSHKMSRLELSGLSYQQMIYSPGYQDIQTYLPQLHPDANNYFISRYSIYEAWRVSSGIGGDIEAFTQLGQYAGGMFIAQTIMHQEEVARALVELETRAKIVEYKDGKFDRSLNPAMAAPSQMGAIRSDIAKKVGKEMYDKFRAGEAKLYESPELIQAMNEADPAVQEELLQKYFEDEFTGAVREAETFWRMWMRSSLADSPVFTEDVYKPGNKTLLKYLSELRTDEYAEPINIGQLTGIDTDFLNQIKNDRSIRTNWDLKKKYTNWDQSFSGTSEFAVKRLLYPKEFAENQGYAGGAMGMRKFLEYNSHDFLSDFLNDASLINETMFTDGIAFDEDKINPCHYYKDPENPGKPLQPGEVVDDDKKIGDPTKDRKFTKTGADGKEQVVIIHRNGTMEFNENFRPQDVQWDQKQKEAAAAYSGRFTQYQLKMADEIRKIVLGPEKVGRVPNVQLLNEVWTTLENLNSEAVDKEERRGGKLNVAEQRARGRIYKENIIALLAEGVLEFNTGPAVWERFRAKKMNAWDVNTSINILRAGAKLTDEQAKKLREEYIAGNPVARFILIGYAMTNPPGVLLAMLLEVFKQGFQFK